MKHSAAFLKLVDDAKSRVREISVEEARKKLESGSARVIDVREESEWAAGHIRGAEYLGRGVLERDIEQKVPDKSAELILYCGGGFRSALSADNLHLRWVAVLRSMDPADFRRGLRHPELGKVLTLQQMLGLYAWHGRHHVAHITSLKKREGW